MHWNSSHASLARINALIGDKVDPYSGQPASKSAVVSINRYQASSYTFAVVRDWSRAKRVIERQQTANATDSIYWSRSACDQGWRIEIASRFSPSISLQYWRHELLSERQALIELDDHENALHRLACFNERGLQAAVFTSARPETSSRQWVAAQLSESTSVAKRYRLMAGRPGGSQMDKGEIVCSCFMVGTNQIQQCLTQKTCQSVDDIGQAIQAGTNCGSCRGELQLMLNQRHKSKGALEETELPAVAAN